MPSNIARATSVTSTAASHSGIKKKFVCAWKGCTKSFSRSEHLHRHALNHKEGNHTCHRCAAHFRRRDLLDRHMQRHKEKDDEAGGDGLGILATRKRLWKDAEGKIVNARRPSQLDDIIKRRVSMEKSPEHSQRPNDRNDAAPLSPPNSLPSTRSSVQMSAEQIGDNGLSWPPMDLEFIPVSDGSDLDFLSNSSWGAPPFEQFMGASSDLPYDDIFKPDTAMSFNAPFTTQSYYTWLFENDGINATIDTAMEQQSLTDMSMSPSSNGPGQLHISYDGGSLDPHLLGPRSEVLSSQGHAQLTAQSQSAFLDLTASESFASSHSTTLLDYSFESPQSAQSSTANLSSANGSSIDPSTSQQASTSSSGTRPTSQISTPPTQRSLSLGPLTLPDSYTRKSHGKLPLITNQARDGLMQLISQSRPTKPGGVDINSHDPLLSISSLQHYSDLFFTRFNSSYPLIHQATFQSSEVHPFLLMAILLLGATYSDKEAHLMAVCIHDIMRALIHSSKEFDTRPKLWMLQTILLVECFGKSRAGEKQHDMSHLYHGLLINLIRRSDCQSACIPPFDENMHDLEEYWHLAVEAEQKRRLAMLCFMWDTQHAVLFSQSLCMNASELTLTLPWDPSAWEATNAQEWLEATRSAPTPPSYLSILKIYTTPNSPPPPTSLNALSRALILHGLMSISWDLNRRDQTSLSLAITSSSVPWQQRMSACYERWKVDFDSYTTAVLSSLSFSPSDQSKFQRWAVANLAVYHTAQLILSVDIIDLQINAGARHIIGRPVTDFDRQRSKSKIGDWIMADDGRQAGKAAWHAARLFRDGVRKLENWNVDEMFHYPWCLYLATLMCWTLHGAATDGRSSSPALGNGSGMSSSSSEAADEQDDEDSDWDSKAEMNALISALTRLDPERETFVQEMWKVARKYKTGGLIRCMVKQLNTVRWAVVMEGMKVLKGVV